MTFSSSLTSIAWFIDVFSSEGFYAGCNDFLIMLKEWYKDKAWAVKMSQSNVRQIMQIFIKRVMYFPVESALYVAV